MDLIPNSSLSLFVLIKEEKNTIFRREKEAN